MEKETAMKILKELHGKSLFAERTALETLIPELKESEDERIRKALIKGVECCKASGWTNFGNNVDIDVVLAWLEKQGGKESDPRYENLEELLAADNIYQMSMNDEMVNEAKEKAAKALSKLCIGKLLGFDMQGEQKPFDYEHATITQKDFAPINDTDEEIAEAIKNTSVLDMVEQKQEWSEEDEEYLRRAITATKEVYPVTANWLKSLKNRVQPQSKEWSEEDEEMTKELIGGFLSSVSPYQLTHTCQEIADWLDSVKCRMKGKEE